MTAREVVDVAEGVFALRYEFFDQTIGLVTGEDSCLVIDTRTTSAQARELQEDVRRITPLPWIVLNTHHHFDHSFGNATFRPAEIWGHPRCVWTLERHGEAMRVRIMEAMPQLADELADVEIVAPTRTAETGSIELGGRTVRFTHAGRGHTDNDVVAAVEDVLFAGDLLENGAPPSFGDSFPLDWPETNERLLDLIRGPVVPGHGDVADRGFAQRQTLELRAAAEAARAAHAAGRPPRAAIRDVPFPEAVARECLARAFAQLDGSLSSGFDEDRTG